MILVDGATKLNLLGRHHITLTRIPIREGTVLIHALQLRILTLSIPHKANQVATVLRVHSLHHFSLELIHVLECLAARLLDQVIGLGTQEVVLVAVAHLMILRVEDTLA